MATPDTYRDERREAPDAEERALDAQREAARDAATIGEFRSLFRERMREAATDGDAAKKAFEKRAELIEGAVGGQEDLKLAKAEAGVLGWNRIGAGRGGIHISSDMIADLGRRHDKNDLKQVAAHEAAHGDQVQLKGTLVLDGKKVDNLKLYEGHAEISGNKAIGESASHHREGQPEAVYAEGQRVALEIIRRTSREDFERALTKDGDLDALTAELATAA